MNSPLFCINDIASEAKSNREEINKNHRDNHKYHLYLSKHTMPFKKTNVKEIKKRITKQFLSNDMYLQLKNYSSSNKPPMLNEEILFCL